MPKKILIKRSSVAGKIPTTADLDIGELAINLADQKIYTKRVNPDTGNEEIVVVSDMSVSSGGTVINKPSITSPTENQTDFNGPFESSAYSTISTFYGPHQYSDWELSKTSDFDTIEISSYNDSTNLTSWNPGGLDKGTVYYVRVRYKSDNHVSEWSDAVKFTTIPNESPVIDSVDWSSDTLYDNATYTVTINASDPDGTIQGYEVTCDDTNVTITQDNGNPNIFEVTFPDYDSDTTITFTYTVTDNDGASTSQNETKNIINYTNIVGLIDSGNNDSINAIAVDSNINVFASGYTNNGSNNDYFLAKLDNNLNVIKQITIDSGNNDFIYATAVDSNNNVFIGGYANNGSNNEYFLTKLDNNLSVIKQITINSGEESSINAIAVDSNNNVFIGGYYGEGGSGPSSPSQQYYIAKLDNNLNVIKQITIDNGDNGKINAITIDSNNNVFVGGYYEKQMFPHPSQTYYIAKFDNNLNVIKQITIKGNQTDSIYAIAVDSNNNIFVGGYASGGSDRDHFLMKLDNNLNVIKQITIKSNQTDSIYAIAVDSNNNVFVGGTLNGYHYTAKLDNNLNVIKQITIDSGNDDSIYAIAADPNNNIFVGGYTNNGSNNDHFLAKLKLEDINGTQTATVGSITFTATERTWGAIERTWSATERTWSATERTWSATVRNWSPIEQTWPINKDTLG